MKSHREIGIDLDDDRLSNRQVKSSSRTQRLMTVSSGALTSRKATRPGMKGTQVSKRRARGEKGLEMQRRSGIKQRKSLIIFLDVKYSDYILRTFVRIQALVDL